MYRKHLFNIIILQKIFKSRETIPLNWEEQIRHIEYTSSILSPLYLRNVFNKSNAILNVLARQIYCAIGK
jgi:hypothetical protein